MTEFYPSDVAKNWYGDGPHTPGEGACEGCKHRDCNLSHTPFFGYWTGDTIDSDVVLLGEAPGGNSDGGRKNKNGSGEPASPDWFTKESARDLVDIADPSDNGLKLPQFFIEDLLDSGIDSYFTNVKKCNDIHSEYGEETYSEARESCVSYLYQELEAVDPDVVVVFSSETQGENSNHNIQYVFEELGIANMLEDSGKLSTVLPDEEDPDSMFPAYSCELGFRVIPAFHFSRASGHLGQRAEFVSDKLGRKGKSYPDKPEWKNRYYDELSDQIAESVN